MSVAAELYDLQEVDLALDRHRARLQEIEEAIQESEELVQARQLKEEASQVVAGLRSRQTELEWDVDNVRSKASEVEVKLYGGTVRNPKELSDLDTDLKLLKGRHPGVRTSCALMGSDTADAESQRRRRPIPSSSGLEANRDQLLEEKQVLSRKSSVWSQRRDSPMQLTKRC